MQSEKGATVRLRFPGDLEYIPVVRKFVSETLQARDRDARFAFRSEIIVDEICNNAVTFGCRSLDDQVELCMTLYNDRTEFVVRDPGGNTEHKARLLVAVEKPQNKSAADIAGNRRLGIEIVKRLSEEIEISTDEDNLTTVRVIRRRGEAAQ